MGWLKVKCSRCWDSHDGMSCEEYQRRSAAADSERETHRLMREQNELIREQNELLKRKP